MRGSLIVGLKTVHFSYYNTDLPAHYVSGGHYQTTFDDKSGYDHVLLLPSSSTFLGLEWEGWYNNNNFI